MSMSVSLKSQTPAQNRLKEFITLTPEARAHRVATQAIQQAGSPKKAPKTTSFHNIFQPTRKA